MVKTPDTASTEFEIDGPDASPLAHRRQFVIAPRPLAFGPGWRSETLPGGLQLSLHEDLPLKRVTHQRREVMLLGRAIPLNDAASDAGDDARDGEKLPSRTRASRFAVLDWPYLMPDPASVFPLLYGETPDGPVVTSSPTLGRLAGVPHSPGREIHPVGLNWTPPPGTVGGGLRKLLRDQKLHLPSLRVEPCPSPISPLGSFVEARDELVDTLIGILRHVGEKGDLVRVMLTAGVDSRTILAAAAASEIRFETVTMIFDGIKPAELDIAAQLSRYFGVRHVVFGPQPRKESYAEVWREHTGTSYASVGADMLVPENQYRYLVAGSTSVGGGCFEIGRRFFRHRFEDLNFDNVKGEDLWRRSEDRPPDPRTIQFFDDWLEWRREHPDGFDLVDSYYLDQRIGGWLSYVEHGLGMYPGDLVLAGNCIRIFSALITPGNREREAGKLQRAAIAAMAPGLARIPINPASARQRLKVAKVGTKRVVKRVIRRLFPGLAEGPLRPYLGR